MKFPLASIALLMLLAAPTALAADPVAAPPEVAAEDFRDGPEGLRIADLARGEGDPLKGGATAMVAIKLWATPGMAPVQIGSAGKPLQVVIGGGSLIRGLDLGLDGMREGGVRYIEIPAALTSGAGTPMTALLTVFSEEQLAAGDPVEPPAGGDAQGATGERPPTGNRLEGSPTTTALREPPASPPEVEDDAWDQKKNGLQIADLVVGDGPELQKGQVVTVEYTGWVVESGERFDSSLARAEPFSFELGGGQVILGWDKGLRGMRVGGTRVLKIPAYLGYGAAGAGSIPPHADLMFKVELLSAK